MGIGSPNPLLLASAASGGGETEGGSPPPSDPVTRSLRFDGSAYLSRSTGSTSTTWTLSFWVKRATISGPSQAQYLATWGISGSAGEGISFRGTTDSSNTDKLGFWNGSTTTYSSGVYRDPSAWANICISVNSGTATVYYNGESILSGITGVQAWGSIRLGAWLNQNELEGMMADVYGVEGSALDHTSFTESNNYGGLKPKAFSGVGTNGFHLKLDDSSDIGADDAGSNDFTATNSSHDVMLDVPTKNYATLNPLSKSSGGSLAEDNLKVPFGGTYPSNVLGSMGVSSGKWYWEVYLEGGSSANGHACGVAVPEWANKNSDPATASTPYAHYVDSRSKFVNNGSATSNSTNFTSQDIIGVALNADDNEISFYKNGSIIGSAQSLEANQTWMPLHKNSSYTLLTQWVNYGQDPTFAGNKTSGQDTSQSEFYYAPPTGFKSLNTSNLDAPTVTPSEHFGVLTYNGAYDNYMNYSGTSPQTVTGTDFTPEIVWIKDRDNVSSSYGNGYHGGYWFDNVMGTGYALNTDLDNSSHSGSSLASGEDGISSFNSNGFSVDEADETNAAADSSGYGGSIDTYERYVAWCWKLGSSGSSSTWASGNTDPDTEKYNASAGVSIIDYYDSEYGGSAITLNHSLGDAPEFAVAFDYEGYTSGHYVWHKDLSSGNYLTLDSSSAQTSDTDYFPASPATATTITLGTSISSGTQSHVALFSGVEGYSKFGKYTGNSSSDGPFVYTGFRPRYLMIKRTTSSDGGWKIMDTARDPHNVVTKNLYAHQSDDEDDLTSHSIDLLSNGFKWRTGGNHENANGHTYIYAAFAESPFKHANAR